MTKTKNGHGNGVIDFLEVCTQVYIVVQKSAPFYFYLKLLIYIA